MYVTATGGDAGGGTNPAIGMMSLLGPCGNLGAYSSVVINEATTVAGQYALNQFADVTGQLIGSPPSNPVGIANAFRVSFNIADVRTGRVTLSGLASSCASSYPTPNCSGLERISSLANLLLACVDSTNANGFAACTHLFTLTATPPGGTTLQALHGIAQNPARNVSNLFALANLAVAYAPALAVAPTDRLDGGLQLLEQRYP
jgi:hypothetical protein